jgi:AraC-like DNA-binding protein
MPLQTLFILFDEDFISNTIHNQTIHASKLLEYPDGVGTKGIDIPSVPFLHTGKMHYLLTSIRQNLFMEDIALQDILHEIIAEFCYINKDTAKQIQKINAVKAATREELYRRLTTAKFFMHDNACNNITIDDIAAAACLNPFHFLRVFKCAYQTTPHQYLMNLKLEKARDLLGQQQHQVSDVCMMVGFESMGSFSNLFKKRFGVSPSSIGKR